MSGVMGLALFLRRLTHCRLWSDLEFEMHLQVKEETIFNISSLV